MAKINFDNLPERNNSNTNNGNANTKTDKSEYMILVGQNVLNPETDEYEFVSLPQPLGIDTMKKASVQGEGSFQELLCKRNDLLEDLLKFAKESLNPGETKEVELTVKIYRKKASQAVKHSKVTFNFIKSKE